MKDTLLHQAFSQYSLFSFSQRPHCPMCSVLHALAQPFENANQDSIGLILLLPSSFIKQQYYQIDNTGSDEKQVEKIHNKLYSKEKLWTSTVSSHDLKILQSF